MAAYTKPNKERKKKRDQIKFINLRFAKWHIVRFRKARGRQHVPQIACFRDEW